MEDPVPTSIPGRLAHCTAGKGPVDMQLPVATDTPKEFAMNLNVVSVEEEIIVNLGIHR